MWPVWTIRFLRLSYCCAMPYDYLIPLLVAALDKTGVSVSNFDFFLTQFVDRDIPIASPSDETVFSLFTTLEHGRMVGYIVLWQSRSRSGCVAIECMFRPQLRFSRLRMISSGSVWNQMNLQTNRSVQTHPRKLLDQLTWRIKRTFTYKKNIAHKQKSLIIHLL